jgi:ribosome maturation factor RimP
LGFDLVRIKVMGGNAPTIQVMAEKPDRTMTVKNCVKLSREIAAVLDVEDPIAGKYTLEVSSPGIDRPLTRLKDFEDFKGFEAKVETTVPIDGQKRFRGRVIGTEGDRVKLKADTGDMEFLFEDIEKAKLILTDELVAASLKGR